MDEAGIDLRGHTSKIVDRFLQEPWDHGSSVCDSANERCPVFPGRTIRVHCSFEDPSQSTEPEDQRFDTFRRARPARAQGLAGGDARGSAGRCDVRMQMAARLATLADSDASARALEPLTR